MKRIVYFGLLLLGCVDPYTPPEIENAEPVLVVDGFINVEETSTIKLSLSQNLESSGDPVPVSNAAVWLEDELGNRVDLFESFPGNYLFFPQPLSASRYRLRIETSVAKSYASSFETIEASPEIDSVTWDLTEDFGVQIQVNTHDDTKSPGYYRWSFDETWLYTSKYESVYIYNYATRQAELRTDDIFHCYRSDNSKDIHVESTVRLDKNVVDHFPLHYISQNSERLRLKYSILVKQYAITANAFNYWQQVKKTTEDLGTLFGPLPTQVTGNIKSTTNANDLVVGYFSMGTTTTQRIFIGSLELVPPKIYDTPYSNCEPPQELTNENVSNFTGPYLLIGGIPNPFGPGIIGYYYSNIFCVDCRASGGVNQKPDFWE